MIDTSTVKGFLELISIELGVIVVFLWSIYEILKNK